MVGSGRLEGRVALVTGGASGPGRATAVALAEAGAHVAVADIDGAGSQETLERITGEGPIFLTSEFLKRAQMERWGIPSHLMMPPSAVAGTVRTLLLLDPSASVPEMQIVPRLEPNFPR